MLSMAYDYHNKPFRTLAETLSLLWLSSSSRTPARTLVRTLAWAPALPRPSAFSVVFSLAYLLYLLLCSSSLPVYVPIYLSTSCSNRHPLQHQFFWRMWLLFRIHSMWRKLLSSSLNDRRFSARLSVHFATRFLNKFLFKPSLFYSKKSDWTIRTNKD